ncbi:MAG: SMEK domain-containing protein, partial [Leptospiraceae bacterium]|nr:SMEK domain-containing protein [Leptospiraceae bacterium]
MISRNQVIDNISFRLSVLKEHVKQLNSLNIQSLNIHAENFYRDFLNLVF